MWVDHPLCLCLINDISYLQRQYHCRVWVAACLC